MGTVPGSANAFAARVIREGQTGWTVSLWGGPKMKNIANRILLFAAAALSLGTAAYGQTLKADVPFAFRAVGTPSTAGRCTVQLKNNGNGLRAQRDMDPRGRVPSPRPACA